MQLYAFVCISDGQDPSEETIKGLGDSGFKNILVLDRDVGDKRPIYRWIKEAGLELTLGFSENVHKHGQVRLKRALQMTNRLALGNAGLDEWAGRVHHVEEYLQFAQAHGFEWSCTLCVTSLMATLVSNARCREGLKRVFIKNNVKVFCLCGYQLVGFHYQIPALWDIQTRLRGRNLAREFGYNHQLLMDFIKDVDILTGANYQAGWNAGVLPLCENAGFKGIITGVPVTLPSNCKIEDGNLRSIINVRRSCSS